MAASILEKVQLVMKQVFLLVICTCAAWFYYELSWSIEKQTVNKLAQVTASLACAQLLMRNLLCEFMMSCKKNMLDVKTKG